MTTSTALPPGVLRSLRTPEVKYPFAYGYLTELIRGHLNGNVTRDRVEAVLEAVDRELRGDAP